MKIKKENFDLLTMVNFMIFDGYELNGNEYNAARCHSCNKISRMDSKGYLIDPQDPLTRGPQCPHCQIPAADPNKFTYGKSGGHGALTCLTCNETWYRNPENRIQVNGIVYGDCPHCEYLKTGTMYE